MDLANLAALPWDRRGHILERGRWVSQGLAGAGRSTARDGCGRERFTLGGWRFSGGCSSRSCRGCGRSSLNGLSLEGRRLGGGCSLDRSGLVVPHGGCVVVVLLQLHLNLGGGRPELRICLRRLRLTWAHLGLDALRFQKLLEDALEGGELFLEC